MSCSHCGGDGLLHLFSSVGPDPCPHCAVEKGVQKKKIEPGHPGYLLPVNGMGVQCNHIPESGWICTREKGHSGLHAGHVLVGTPTQYGTWR